jgi:hypothetical protein
MNRLEQWKEDVAAGRRRAMSRAEMIEQAAYRARKKNQGRYPMSFERRECLAVDIARKKAQDKIERLQMIKELAEL